MKIILVLVIAAISAVSLRGSDRLVMVAPFDNLSDVHRYIDYQVDTGAVSSNPRKQYHVDRYSHACREYLEDTIASIPGLKPVERAQFDRVMLEVSGGIHDGAVDPEKAQQVAIKLGADAIIMGSILDLKQTVFEYDGYARIKDTIYSATIRVRLIDLTKDNDSKKIVAAIPSSYRVTGTSVIPETPYYRIRNSDAYFSALTDALQKLETDDVFKSRILPKVVATTALGLVKVEFAIVPSNSSVFVRAQNGWRYIGGTPLDRNLPAGLEVPVRIEKEGFAPWETIILPEPALRITHELQPLKGSDNKATQTIQTK